MFIQPAFDCLRFHLDLRLAFLLLLTHFPDILILTSITLTYQETQYIAKDIALFCTVLKDLARALELGQKAQLFRQNAFDTSLKIISECQTVFKEIEDILKKITKCGNPLDGNFSLPRGEKILWIFRKGKVEF